MTLELLVTLGQVPVEGACYRLRNELLVRILPTGSWRVEVPDQSTSHQSGAQLGLPDTPRRSQTTIDCASHDLAETSDLLLREPTSLFAMWLALSTSQTQKCDAENLLSAWQFQCWFVIAHMLISRSCVQEGLNKPGCALGKQMPFSVDTEVSARCSSLYLDRTSNTRCPWGGAHLEFLPYSLQATSMDLHVVAGSWSS